MTSHNMENGGAFAVGERVVFRRFAQVAVIAGTQPHPESGAPCFHLQLPDGGGALVPVEGAFAHVRPLADRATAERMLAILQAPQAPPDDGIPRSAIELAPLLAQASPEQAATILRLQYEQPPSLPTSRVIRTLEQLLFAEMSAALGVSVDELKARIARR